MRDSKPTKLEGFLVDHFSLPLSFSGPHMHRPNHGAITELERKKTESTPSALTCTSPSQATFQSPTTLKTWRTPQ
jgi:hypothetical protein